MARRETLLYTGDGIRVPENGELVGHRVNVKGRRGTVVDNDALTVVVEWERFGWLKRLIRKMTGHTE